MTIFQKIGLVGTQIIMSLAFGVVGFIVSALSLALLHLFSSTYSSLFSETGWVLIGGIIGMQLGVGYEGKKYLKEVRKENTFVRLFMTSCVGMIIGLVILYIYVLISSENSSNLVYVLFVILPLVGSIAGFNNKFIRS